MSTPMFKVGEELFCVAAKDNVPYEAKIVGFKEVKGARCYVVHYKGWNSRYDEKISVDSVSGKLFKSLADYKPPASNGAASTPSTSAAAAAAAPKPKPAAKPAPKASPKKAPAAEKPQVARKFAKTEKPARNAKATTSAGTSNQASTPASSPSTSMNNAFAIHEEFVCLRGDDPCEAKVMDIKEHHGHMRYNISYKGLSAKFNDNIRVGSEEGRMFKGTLKEYLAKNPAGPSTSAAASSSAAAGPSQEPATTTTGRAKRGAAAAAAAEPAASEVEETATKKSKK